MTQAAEIISCDIAILGGGAGGLSLAAGAVQLGANVVLVESGKMGGDCLNYGCVPSKALLSAAKSAHHMRNAKTLGVHAKTIKINFQEVMQHVRASIEHIAEHDSVARFEALGVRVIQASGKFINSQTLEAGAYHIQAKRFVIATGSHAFVPPISGLDSVSYETNETIFNIEILPSHLIVIGGGPIGCELAQAFAMLGSNVTILEGFQILPQDDPDAVGLVRESLKSMGICIYEGIKVSSVKSIESKIRKGLSVVIESEGEQIHIDGTHLLVATGRRANVDGLGLEASHVKYSDRGIDVDARLRSSNKKIYAMGDVAGRYQFTHIANYHAGIVLRNILFKLPVKINTHAVPWVTYTEPELAHVGMLVKNAEKRPDLSITTSCVADNDRAVVSGETRGKITVITNRKGRVLGATIVGPDAGELILPWVIAVREKKSLRMFTDTIIPYPTLSEMSKRVAGEFYKPQLFSRKMRNLVRFLLKLG
ncbi:MAG: FAD-dependent oxidoreductase [Legionellaceae bacterium]|nr:FAD-dependent oxidoreductase [Legionellaceae bacterium]